MNEGLRVLIEESQALIFDVDGTLLDSMPIWSNLGSLFLESLGIKAEKNLGTKLFPMTLNQGAKYLKERYSLPLSIKEIQTGNIAMVEKFYRDEVSLKGYMKEILDYAKALGLPMIIATSGHKDLVEAALTRLAIKDYFMAVLTSSEMGVGKENSKIFLEAANLAGSEISKTLVFEDGLYAIETADRAGFKIVGIYDSASLGDQDRIKEMSDFYLKF